MYPRKYPQLCFQRQKMCRPQTARKARTWTSGWRRPGSFAVPQGLQINPAHFILCIRNTAVTSTTSGSSTNRRWLCRSCTGTSTVAPTLAAPTRNSLASGPDLCQFLGAAASATSTLAKFEVTNQQSFTQRRLRWLKALPRRSFNCQVL